MNEKDRLISALKQEGVDRVPCTSPLQTGTLDLMEASGSYWPEAHNDSALMARLALAAHTLGRMENVRVPFDVTVDATAFGAVTGKESIDRQPAIMERPISSPEELEAAEVPDPYKDGRSMVVLEAVRELAGGLDGVPVICATVSPFMLAGQLRGDEMAIMDTVKNPTFLKGILDLAAEWNIEFSKAALEAGADIVTMVDATSSGTVLGPAQYEEFAMPYQRRVADAIRKAGGLSILHICGNTIKTLDGMVRTGVDGISVDQQMDIAWVAEQLRGRCTSIGNVSPTSTLLKKGPAEVEAEVKRCIDGGVDIIAPGCGFASETPLANMQAMAEATAKHGKR